MTPYSLDIDNKAVIILKADSITDHKEYERTPKSLTYTTNLDIQ